ncbi:MAG: sulfatase-like hydrolase/transferase [Acidobacteria bacterium]|nr:sulfatase-like hydrolase/transferase [Acidobacteriota bacterium]
MNSGWTRRDFLALSGASLLESLVGHSQESSLHTTNTSADTSEKLIAEHRNIVIFMPDSMRADALACYGNPITKTPNFDRLAREGTRFANCHVQFPVCAASRCSMLTGWPTSVRGHRSLFYLLRPEEPNLFRYLKKSGYDVFWFGKNDALAPETFPDSVTEWGEGTPGKTRPPVVKDLTPGVNSMFFSAGGDRRDLKDYHRLQSAIQILQRKEQDRPFCIFIPQTEPHPPYTAPAEFYNMYSPDSIPPLAPAGLKKKPDYHEGIRRTYHLDKLDEGTFRKIRAVYYGKVSLSDWLLGELLAALEATGHGKDTALLVASDHGDYAGEYGLIEKWPSGLEDCLTHVPMLARIPGGKPGIVAKDMVELYDIMQTCLDIAGVKANHTHFSRSLLPQVAGGAGDPARASFAEGGYNVYEPQCFEPLKEKGRPYDGKLQLQNEEPVMVSRSAMVRTRTHKFISRPQDQWELYDSIADPLETRNLFGESSVSAVQAELQTRLLVHYVNTTGIAPMSKDPRGLPKHKA